MIDVERIDWPTPTPKPKRYRKRKPSTPWIMNFFVCMEADGFYWTPFELLIGQSSIDFYGPDDHFNFTTGKKYSADEILMLQIVCFWVWRPRRRGPFLSPAIGQRITWVLVVVVHLLVQFLFLTNCKFLADLGFEPMSSCNTVLAIWPSNI